MAVGREVARAAQARDPDRIQYEIVGVWIEQWSGGVEIARTRRHLRHEEFGVAGAVDVAAAAAHTGLPCHATENAGRIEGQIAETDQVGLAARHFGPEHLARLVERVLVEFRFRRKRGLITIDRKRRDVSL